jgi:hypothetical protein
MSKQSFRLVMRRCLSKKSNADEKEKRLPSFNNFKQALLVSDTALKQYRLIQIIPHKNPH